MFKTTATRLFSALLGYVTLILLMMTLNPFFMALPDEISISFDSSLQNLVQNVVLFLPVGFLYRLTTGRRGVLLLGAGLSVGIELTQLFVPARTTSAIDILTNTLGAGLGGAFFDLLADRVSMSITSGTIIRLRLETPLMGLVYLLVPLLWIDTLALNEAPNRWILTLLIGVMGAVIFSDLFRHWWEVVNYRVVTFAALAAGAWFLVGAGPGLVRSRGLLLLVLGVMLLTGILTAIPASEKDRRFERYTLRRIVPILTLYLILLSLWFPFSPFGSWHSFFGFTDQVSETSQYALYPRLEYLAAFTILGFVAAEWRGRSELSLLQELPRLLMLATAAALSLEIFSGFQSARGASFVRFILAVTGAIFGGTIYHLSRAHIRFLLGR